jgi:hypothetical protein
MHSDNHLYDELTRNLQRLTKHYDAEKERLEKYIEVQPYPDKLTVFTVHRSDGTNPLLEIEMARSTTLAAMANIKASQKNGRK